MAGSGPHFLYDPDSYTGPGGWSGSGTPYFAIGSAVPLWDLAGATDSYATIGGGYWNADTSYSTDPSASPSPLNFAGAKVAMQAGWVTNAAGVHDSDQPNGPLTIRYYDERNRPLRATRTVMVEYIATSVAFSPDTPWPSNPLEGINVTPLDRNGSALAAAQDMWTLYDISYSHPTYTGDHWGLLIEHRDPGERQPGAWSISGFDIEIDPEPAATFLRQRQSPVRCPSRVSYRSA